MSLLPLKRFSFAHCRGVRLLSFCINLIVYGEISPEYCYINYILNSICYYSDVVLAHELEFKDVKPYGNFLSGGVINAYAKTTA